LGYRCGAGLISTMPTDTEADPLDIGLIPGWFDYEAFWDEAIASAPDGSTLVELGLFCGKSLVYIARQIRESGKNLRLIGIDTFLGSEEFEGRVFLNDQPWHTIPRGMLAQMCIQTLGAYGVLDDVILIRSDSAKAAELFIDESVWAVFVDADHSEDAVQADILAWRDKIEPGGKLGGHDYWQFETVKAAVDKLIPERDVQEGRTWWEARIS
jgi:hypothetical protein